MVSNPVKLQTETETINVENYETFPAWKLSDN